MQKNSEFSKEIDREVKPKGAEHKKLLEVTKKGRDKVKRAVKKKEPIYFVSNNALCGNSKKNLRQISEKDIWKSWKIWT